MRLTPQGIVSIAFNAKFCDELVTKRLLVRCGIALSSGAGPKTRHTQEVDHENGPENNFVRSGRRRIVGIAGHGQERPTPAHRVAILSKRRTGVRGALWNLRGWPLLALHSKPRPWLEPRLPGRQQRLISAASLRRAAPLRPANIFSPLSSPSSCRPRNLIQGFRGHHLSRRFAVQRE
jgi:hypothetical protein